MIPASERGQPQGTTVSADDRCRLWTAEIGHGAPLIMCYGGPGLWDMFGTLAASLSGPLRVIRWGFLNAVRVRLK